MQPVCPWSQCCHHCPLPTCGARSSVTPSATSLPADFVVDQMQAVKFAFDIARGMAFLHTLEPLIPRHHLNSRSIMVSPAARALQAGPRGWL